MFAQGDDEIVLIEKWRKGDAKAFDRLYDMHISRLQQFALRHTNDSCLAEELVMNVMLKVWQGKEKLRAETVSLAPFLFHILKAEIIDHYRKRRMEFMPLDPFCENTQSAEQSDSPAIARELQQLYEQGIDKLTPMQQKVYRMRHENNHSYQEIAQKLQIAIKTVDRHLHSANHAIRTYISKYGDLTIIILTLLQQTIF